MMMNIEQCVHVSTIDQNLLAYCCCSTRWRSLGREDPEGVVKIDGSLEVDACMHDVYVRPWRDAVEFESAWRARFDMLYM